MNLQQKTIGCSSVLDQSSPVLSVPALSGFTYYWTASYPRQSLATITGNPSVGDHAFETIVLVDFCELAHHRAGDVDNAPALAPADQHATTSRIYLVSRRLYL